MNEENLKVIDIKSEDNIKSVQESSFIDLPVQKKEPSEDVRDKIGKQKVIDKLPSWSIEPPLEINRGRR